MMTPEFEALVSADYAILGHALQIQFPDTTVRLTDGGQARFSVDGTVQTFNARHPVFGTIAALAEVEEGVGDQAWRWDFSLHVPSQTSLVDFASPAASGSPLSFWVLAMHPETGQAEAFHLFDCETDTPKVQNPLQGLVMFECTTEEELMLQNTRQRSQAHFSHQDGFPGELGFRNKTGVTRDIYWRASRPRGSSVTGGGGGGPGGGINENIALY